MPELVFRILIKNLYSFSPSFVKRTNRTIPPFTKWLEARELLNNDCHDMLVDIDIDATVLFRIVIISKSPAWRNSSISFLASKEVFMYPTNGAVVGAGTN